MAKQRRVPKPGQDLATLYPQVASEWDYEKNGDLRPEQFASQSNKKVWWKCGNCGNSWQAIIFNRVKGTGCPYDSERVPIPGKTDLATLYPHVAAEWNSERNSELKPEQFAPLSNKKVWWKCSKCGNSWQAIIRDRVRGSSCPYDLGRIPIPGKTDFATLCAHIAGEWDYERNGDLKPEQFTVQSRKMIRWKCSNCGNSWQSTIYNRTNGNGCPYDSRRVPILGKTDLATLYPNIAAEWDYERNDDLRPEQFASQSNKKVWWKCGNCGNSWQTTISSRVLGSQCPYDSGRLPIRGKTDLATLYPHIAAEWDYDRNENLLPEQFAAKSGKKVWWKCKHCGNSWCAAISERVRGTGCPYDLGKIPIPGKTDLATLYPDVAAEWDYERNNDLIPEQFTAQSNKKVWWKCAICGTVWQSVISNRTRGGGCPNYRHHKI